MVIVVLGAILVVTKQFQPLSSVSPKSAIFLVLSGFATGASWVCYFRALKLGSVSQVAPVDKLSVVLVAMFGGIFRGERLSAQAWAGGGMVGAGAVMIALA